MISVAAVFAIAVASASPGASSDVDMRCGAYCLYISLKALGAPAESYADIESKHGAPSASGYSMGALAEVAEGYGAHSLGVITNPENLARRAGPFACIARLGQNHFVNIGEIADGKATIFDVPKRYELPLDTLGATWDGTALLIAMSPLVAEEDLASRSWYAVGMGVLVGLALVGMAILFWGRRAGSKT